MSQLVGDITILSVGGSSVLASFDGVTLTMTHDTADTSSLKSKGTRADITKASGTVAIPLRSLNGSSITASHFDASALQLGALEFPCFASTGINIGYTKTVLPCVGAKFRNEVNNKLQLSATISVMATAGMATTLLTPFDKDTAVTGAHATYTVTFNGVTFTFPVLIQQVTLTAERDGAQVLDVTLSGRAPDTGDFPTAPTGTTGLLAKALNDYKTALAFSFQSAASTAGVNVSGNLFFDSVSFTIQDEQIVPISYNFRNSGGWDVAAGS